MALKPITLESIEVGSLIETANEALQELCRDLIDRPRLESERSLTIKVTLAPKENDIGRGQTRTFVDVGWTVKKTKPGSTGMITRAFVEGDKVLHDDSDPMRTNLQQTTIHEVLEHQAAHQSLAQ